MRNNKLLKRWVVSISMTCMLGMCSGIAMADESVVTEEEPLVSLKLRLFEAQKSLYSLFSELNDDDYYDVECVEVVQTGSLISHVKCEPNYIGNLILHYGASREGSDRLWNVPRSALREHSEKLQEIMLGLASDEPELASLIDKYRVLSVEMKERGR